MPTSNELSFANLIAECRTNLKKRSPGLLHWLGIKARPSASYEDRVNSHLLPHYKILEKKGDVVWGAVAQVNMNMFSTGPIDLPGVTVYSSDNFYDAHPQNLAAIGRACFQFKNTVPVDVEFQTIAARMTDEFDQTTRLLIPNRLADGREVFMGATMFHRSRLPESILRASILPMIIAPQLTDINMILPLECWPHAIRVSWRVLQDLLERSQTMSSSQEIARAAEKRSVEDQGSDWDVEAMPVRVTHAMAEAYRSQSREMNLDLPPLLVIGIKDDGIKYARLAQGYDPESEHFFVSNGVMVVVRKDQLERLKGAVVDYKSSSFAKGIVIYLKGK